MDAIYSYTIPTFVKFLGTLRNTLDKIEAFAAEKNIDQSVILNDRLAPDMFPFIRQIQIACDNAKGAAARLSGTENPKHEDDEVTIDDLKARINKTLEFVQSVPESAFADAANRQIILPYYPDKYLTGYDYARAYAIPNFLFHVTIAYAIARHNGISVGKADFMNGLPFKDLK